MKSYKIAFIGMGSIGKRHLKNLCTALKADGIEYSVDLFRSDLKRELEGEITALIDNQYLLSSPVSLDTVYDMVFITNPTKLHFRTLKDFLPYGKAFFVEKPIFDTTDVDMNELGDISEKTVYVACPLRYNAVISYVRENIRKEDVVSVRAISSSYLPDWRPGTDYRTCYSAHKEMGGGVSIDLIHEWDYLSFLFGEPTRGYSIISKKSELQIDSDDTALYIAESDGISFEVHLDYFGRKTVRELDIFTKDDTVRCDIINGTVSYLKSGKNVKFQFERNDFQMNEIRHFLDIVSGKAENDSTAEHALKVLKIARGEFS